MKVCSIFTPFPPQFFLLTVLEKCFVWVFSFKSPKALVFSVLLPPDVMPRPEEMAFRQRRIFFPTKMQLHSLRLIRKDRHQILPPKLSCPTSHISKPLLDLSIFLLVILEQVFLSQCYRARDVRGYLSPLLSLTKAGPGALVPVTMLKRAN